MSSLAPNRLLMLIHINEFMNDDAAMVNSLTLNGITLRHTPTISLHGAMFFKFFGIVN